MIGTQQVECVFRVASGTVIRASASTATEPLAQQWQFLGCESFLLAIDAVPCVTAHVETMAVIEPEAFAPGLLQHTYIRYRMIISLQQWASERAYLTHGPCTSAADEINSQVQLELIHALDAHGAKTPQASTLHQAVLSSHP